MLSRYVYLKSVKLPSLFISTFENIELAVANRARFHGSAYRKQRIAAYGAGNSALTSRVFHGLAGNFCLCACIFQVTIVTIEPHKLVYTAD